MAAASSLVVDRIDLVEMTHNESQVSPITGTHINGGTDFDKTPERHPSSERPSVHSRFPSVSVTPPLHLLCRPPSS